MAQRRTLTFLVDLKDKATSKFQRINRDGLGSLKKGVRGLTRVLKVGAIAVVGYVTAWGLLATRGGKVLGVQRAFTRAVGDLEGALIKLRTASLGLISTYELMVGFNQAVTLGAVENIKQYAELTKVALTLGIALGVDAAFALESLTLGIGRQSRMILDNLGLIVRVEAANKAYALTLGITTAELTDNQKAVAFRTAAMEAAREKIQELGEVEEVASFAVTRFGVAVENARDEIGKMLAQSPLLEKFFNALATLIDKTALVLTSGAPAIKIAAAELGIVAGNAFSAAFLNAIIAVGDSLTNIVLPKFLEKFVAFLNPVRRLLRMFADDAVEEMNKAIDRLAVLTAGLEGAAAGPGGVAAAGGGGGGVGGGGVGGGRRGGGFAGFMDQLILERDIRRRDVTRGLIGPPGEQIAPINITVLTEALSMWEQIGIQMGRAVDQGRTLADVITGGLVNGMVSFNQAFSRGIQNWIQGTGTLGQALKGAFLGALASIAAGFAEFYTAQAVAALAQGILGDPRGFGAAAKYSAAAVIMGTVAGIAASGASGGGGGFGGAGSFAGEFAGVAAGPGGTIVIQGGILDMSDPRQADALANAISDLMGLRRGSITIVQGG